MNDASGQASRTTGKPVSELQRRLQSADFVITTEVSPPLSADASEFVAGAMPLKGLATAVNVTDGAGAKAHMSALVASHFLAQNGIEPIFQMTCRDRNRIALQSDLLGAMALGIRNILILKGDDPKAGDQPDAKPVFDLDSAALLATAHAMRAKRVLPTGTAIKGDVSLFLGAADMPIDPAPGWVPKSLMAKADAGADFTQTQFCMDMKVARNYAARLVDLGLAQRLPMLIGVCPIPSAKSARWMREKLFGTLIPDEIIDRLEQAADPKQEGKKICVEILQQLATIPGVAGAHIMAPVNPSAVPEVIAASGVTRLKRASA
jgi:methylenetetrahydrofolate reductase (NADPH)